MVRPMGETALWLGAYPPSGPEGPAGQGEGIWRLRLDPRTGGLTGALAAALPAPSFLARGPGGMLYAASETAPGTVTALEVVGEGLVPVATVAAGGDSPCHLLVTEQALYVATYGSGTVSVLPLDADGRFTAQVLASGGPVQVHGHQGSGPRADRQEAPHAHSTMLSPDGRYVLAADLGTDEVRRLRRRPDGLLDD
ncbi:hypothetical protein N869_04095, partial [Cellulomonas bogoriensis 69B4 = DSM 16987]